MKPLQPFVLGENIEPDWMAQILGTGYMEFHAPCGIDGLAKEREDRLDVLCVFAQTVGTGQFREFIRRAQAQYRTVCIWEDWNPIIGLALARYGFAMEIEIQGDGEIIHGWRWDSPTPVRPAP